MPYPHRVMVKYTPGDSFLDVSAWIDKYCKGRVLWEYIVPGEGGMMTLELEEDVTFFTLRWGGKLPNISLVTQNASLSGPLTV